MEENEGKLILGRLCQCVGLNVAELAKSFGLPGKSSKAYAASATSFHKSKLVRAIVAWPVKRKTARASYLARAVLDLSKFLTYFGHGPGPQPSGVRTNYLHPQDGAAGAAAQPQPEEATGAAHPQPEVAGTETGTVTVFGTILQTITATSSVTV